MGMYNMGLLLAWCCHVVPMLSTMFHAVLVHLGRWVMWWCAFHHTSGLVP